MIKYVYYQIGASCSGEPIYVIHVIKELEDEILQICSRIQIGYLDMINNLRKIS